MRWKKWIVILLVVLAFVLRLAITTVAMHDDMFVQSGWGVWIYKNGMKGFYENQTWTYGWPNQPPLISWLYGFGFSLHEWINTLLVLVGHFVAINRLGASHIPWFYNFTVWFTEVKYPNTYFAIGELICLKLIPIVADFILAGIIFLIVKRFSNKQTAVIYTLIYLYSPFAWFESAIWGQHDQLSLIFLLLALLAINSKKFQLMTGLLLAISVGLKVTTIMFLPLFLWLATKNKNQFTEVLVGGVIAIFLYFILVTKISTNDFATFNINLQKQIFAKSDWATWVNSFNFWRLTTGFLTDSRKIFLGLSLGLWGYIVFGFGYIYALYVGRKKDFWSGLKALFIVGFWGWLTMVSMHERYLFPAVISGLLLSVKYKKLFKYWLGLSLIFMINLYAAWWQTNYYLEVMAKILSGVMIYLAIVMTRTITKEEKD